MTRLYTADYSTGTFLQWEHIQNKIVSAPPEYYSVPGYPLQLALLGGDCGYCGRFEVRTGDVPPSGGGERSEVGEDTPTHRTPVGSTRWYAFSIKFDSTFPSNHASLGWGVTSQWKDDIGPPTIFWGFDSGTPDGYFSLCQEAQSAPDVYLNANAVRLLDIPLNRGVWIDIKMEVNWSGSDAAGYVNCWINNVRQTFSSEAGGGQTFNGRTVVPGAGYVHYHGGYYRANGIADTGIIYHSNFRIADSQASV